MSSRRQNTRNWKLELAALVTLALLVLAGALAAKDDKTFVMPRPSPAVTYPAHDANSKEKVSVAADPYDVPGKAAIFRVKYREEDLLPVFLVITNDGDQPISLTDIEVELVTRRKSHLHPARPEDIYRRIAREPVSRDQPVGSPFPIPRRTVKRSIKKEEEAEVRDSRFAAQAVEPHATQAGFVFFDVEGLDAPLAGAHLYVSGIRNNAGQLLIFFDIPMEKYLTYQPGK